MTDDYMDTDTAKPEEGGEELELQDDQLDDELELMELDGATQPGEAGDEGTGGPSTHTQLSVPAGGNNQKVNIVKNVWETAPTLDLSSDNVEKAYREFKAEQLEKLAYENVRKGFQERFDAEMVTEQSAINKSNYDAQSEVTELKKQFSELLTTLTDERTNVIAKHDEAVAELDIPSNDEIAKMSWNEINDVMARLEGY